MGLIVAFCNYLCVLLYLVQSGGSVMERQLPQSSLSSGERIALDAAMADLCHGGQASAPDRGRPATPAIKHSEIFATLSAAAWLTTHTECMPIRF